jgi:hypothetical protein
MNNEEQKTTEMKQTAVEWLVEKLQESGIPLMTDEFEMIQQAKEMEKQQIVDAFSQSRLTHPMIGFKHLSFNDYINTTYGGNK